MAMPARKARESGQLGFAAAMARRHMDQRIPPELLASKGPFFDAQRFEARFWPLYRPWKGRVRRVLRRGPEIRPGDAQGSRRGDRYRRARREVRTVYREKKLNPGSCYAGWAQGDPIGRDWRRKGR